MSSRAKIVYHRREHLVWQIQKSVILKQPCLESAPRRSFLWFSLRNGLAELAKRPGPTQCHSPALAWLPALQSSWWGAGAAVSSRVTPWGRKRSKISQQGLIHEQHLCWACYCWSLPELHRWVKSEAPMFSRQQKQNFRGKHPSTWEENVEIRWRNW